MLHIINIKENGNINIVNEVFECHQVNNIDWLVEMIKDHLSAIIKLMKSHNGVMIHIEKDEYREFVHLTERNGTVKNIPIDEIEGFDEIMNITRNRVYYNEFGDLCDRLSV